MSTFYELTEEMQRLADEIEAATDPDTGVIDMPDETIAKFFRLEGATDQKTESYIRLMESWKAEADIREAEYKAYRDLIEKHHAASKAALARITRLKDYMKYCMESAGLHEVKTEHFTVKIQKNGGLPKVETPTTPDFRKWPEDLFQVKTEPDTDAIRRAAADGRELPEGVLVYHGTHIRIR